MNILDELRDDHLHLRSAMTDLETAPPRLEAMAEFSHRLATHARLEEKYLFEPLSSALPTDHGPLAVMHEEHDEIEGRLAHLAEIDGSTEAGRREIAYLVAIARSHFMKEEEVLFQFAERLLDGSRLATLGDSFRAERAAALPAALDAQNPVATLAREYPGTVAVFQKHGIDFCCGGKRSVASAAVERRLCYPELAAELAAAISAPAATGADRDWNRAATAELVGHVLSRYHAGLREELERLEAMALRARERHGAGHSELVGVADAVVALRTAFLTHLDLEEREIFPALLAGRFDEIASTLGAAEADHEAVGTLLSTLRALTGGFVPPEAACNTWRGLYFGLAELERDTHQHVHLENNLLFPRALAARAPALAHA